MDFVDVDDLFGFDSFCFDCLYDFDLEVFLDEISNAV